MFIYLFDVFVRFFGLGWHSFRANGWNLFDLVVANGSFITTLAVRFDNVGFVTQQLQKLFLVSIAFKLVQRTNSLNMLFKTAVYVSLMYCSMGFKLTGSQCESACYYEFAWALACAIPVLCDLVC